MNNQRHTQAETLLYQKVFLNVACDYSCILRHKIALRQLESRVCVKLELYEITITVTHRANVSKKSMIQTNKTLSSTVSRLRKLE